MKCSAKYLFYSLNSSCKNGKDPYEDKPLTLEGLIKCFQVIRQDYYEEYKVRLIRLYFFLKKRLSLCKRC